MADLPEIVTVGDADHPGLHRAERREVNALRRRAAALEAGRSIGVRGELDTTDQLPAVGEAREGWLVAGHLWAWDTDTASWTERGSVQGPPGPQGDPGPQGVQGGQGVPGTPGATGATGAQGLQGVQGVKGDQGLPGAGLSIKGNVAATANLPTTGNTGGDAYIIGTHLWVWQTNTASWLDVGVIPQGPQGVPGVAGPQGAPGVKGDKGDPGPTGAQGPQGLQGPAGSSATATTDASKLTSGTMSEARLPVISTAKVGDLSARYAPAPYDFLKVQPRLLTTLDLYQPTVMQSAVKEPVTGDIFASQSTTDDATGKESITVTRCGADGTQLDHMTLTNAGHGTVISVQRIGSSTYLWLAWSEALAGGAANDLVRIQYRAGATLARASTSYFTVMPKFGSSYVLPALDEGAGYIGYRISDGTTETWQRRKLADVLAGVDKLYGVVGPLPQAPPTMQGFATIDDDLYRYTGTGAGEEVLITRFAWATGALTGTYHGNGLGLRPGAVLDDGYREPEGISIYRDPASGRASLLAGVTVGQSGSRKYQLHIFPNPLATIPTGDRDLTVQYRLPVELNGQARHPLNNAKSMAALDQPGWYYMTAAEYAAMTDRPSDWANSGHFLQVSGYDYSGTVVQTLTRNTTAGTLAQWVRVVGADGSRNSWYRNTMTSVAYA